ncbi:MAG: hypothetical protein KIH80_001385 [Flavobacteriia bacterium]|nr:hypothetical protein [Flavobacteriia bacterium]
MFDMIDSLVAEELEVDIETYVDIIEKKCTHWQRQFIIFTVLSGREDKMERAKQIFKECEIG